MCQGGAAPGLSTGVPTNFAVPHSYVSLLCHPKPGVTLLNMTDGHVCGGFEKSKGRGPAPVERRNQKLMKQHVQCDSVLIQKKHFTKIVTKAIYTYFRVMRLYVTFSSSF